ncbi:MAG: hypothetical protein J5843_02015 [Clostridia bacterium]|nr:hypothetical protein [Clostridia bacterium]
MDINVQRILWMLLTGVVIACIVALIMRRALGSFVRKLLDSGANGPDNAVTLSELGVRETGYLRSCLKGRGPLSTVVSSTATEIPRYYINEKDIPHAKSKFKKESFSLPLIIVCIVLLAGAAVGAVYLWPGLTGLWSALFPD